MLLNLLSQSHIGKPLLCSQILVINNAAMSILMHRACPQLWIISFGQIPRSGITRSQDMDIFMACEAHCQIALQRVTVLLCVFDDGIYRSEYATKDPGQSWQLGVWSSFSSKTS